MRYAGTRCCLTCIFIVASFEDIFLDDISVYITDSITHIYTQREKEKTHTKVRVREREYFCVSIFRPEIRFSFSSRDETPPNLDRVSPVPFPCFSRINVRCLSHPDRTFLLFYTYLPSWNASLFFAVIFLLDTRRPRF